MEDTEIICRNEQVIRRVLAKLSREELVEVVDVWEEATSPDTPPANSSAGSESLVSSSKEKPYRVYPKREVMDYILRYQMSTGINALQLAEIDMKYRMEKRDVRKWKVLNIIFSDDPMETEGVYDSTQTLKKMSRWCNDVESMKKELEASLKIFYKHHVYCTTQENKIWIRISFYDGLKKDTVPKNSHMVYLVYFVGSTYILVSSLKAEYREYIYRSLVKALDGLEIREWNLSGTRATSLEDLLLNRTSQGPYARFRLGQADKNPLSVSQQDKMKRLRSHHEDPPHPLIQLAVEDGEHRQRTQSVLETQFGSARSPSLNRIDWDVITAFRGRPKTDGIKLTWIGTFPFKCRFEGMNVMEGLRNLCLHDIMITPLPPYLATIPSSAMNTFTITDASLEEEE